VLADRVDKVLELAGVSVVADGGGVAGSAGGALELAIASRMAWSSLRGLAKSRLSIFFFEDGRAGGAVDFDSF